MLSILSLNSSSEVSSLSVSVVIVLLLLLLLLLLFCVAFVSGSSQLLVYFPVHLYDGLIRLRNDCVSSNCCISYIRCTDLSLRVHFKAKVLTCLVYIQFIYFFFIYLFSVYVGGLLVLLLGSGSSIFVFFHQSLCRNCSYVVFCCFLFFF